MRRIAATLVGALCVARAASAQAPPPPAQPPAAAAPRAAPPPSAGAPRAAPPKGAEPDLDFLEYLGSWQGDDDEWLAIKEWDKDAAPKDAAAKPAAPPGKPTEPVAQQAGSDHEKNR